MTNILQLKIRLDGTKPPVWRRILMKDSITFDNLHEIIQIIMGWTNYHLYEFTACGLSILVPSEDYRDEVTDSRKIELNEVITTEKQKFSYVYDFGDNWEHTITVEKIMPKDSAGKYPLCIAGKMACPPEDCGGVWGYEEFLEAIKDPNHKEHKEMLEWIGGEFDPEEFNVDEVNNGLVQLR